MKLGITFTDIEMFGRRLTIGDVKTLLSQLDRTDVLEFCARLNAINEVVVGPGIAWRTQNHLQLLERLLHDLLIPVFAVRRIDDSSLRVSSGIPVAFQFG